jgi:DNA-binding winged helix-turn-helix (wHTH) protein
VRFPDAALSGRILSNGAVARYCWRVERVLNVPCRGRIPTAMTYCFGDFEVDSAAYEVRRGGHRVPLARQPMDLLLLLLEHRQSLVSREDIAKRLWDPGVFTDLDAGIRTAILRIRQVLSDSPESPRCVETVTGKGYRFVAPVEVVATWASA